MSKLESWEYAEFYQTYIQIIIENDKNIVENLEDSFQKAMHIFSNMDKEKYLFRYAKGKWTIKELLQHLIDTERIFNYRALRFSRNDKTVLPGFEENHYVEASCANQRMFKDLLEEFNLLRKLTIVLYKSFDDEMLLKFGKASGTNMSVRAMGYITSGHLLHHLQVIKERYL